MNKGYRERVWQILDQDNNMKPIYGKGTRYYVKKADAIKAKEKANKIGYQGRVYRVVEFELVPNGEVY